MNEMESKDWVAQFEGNTVNENYSNFLSILNEVCDRNIPTKTVVIRPDDKPFMNNNIRKLMRRRDRAHYKAKTTDNPNHWLK